MLQCFVRLSVCTECTVAKRQTVRPRAKVESLLTAKEVIYEKSLWYQNE